MIPCDTMWYHVIPCKCFRHVSFHRKTNLSWCPKKTWCGAVAEHQAGEATAISTMLVSAPDDHALEELKQLDAISLGDRKIVWKIIWKTIWKLIWKITVCLPQMTTLALSYVIMVFVGINLRKDDESMSRTRFVLLQGNAYRKLPGIVLDRKERGVILRRIPNVLAIWTSDQFGICFALLPFPWCHALIPKGDMFGSTLFGRLSMTSGILQCSLLRNLLDLVPLHFRLYTVCGKLYNLALSCLVLAWLSAIDEIEVGLAWEGAVLLKSWIG